MSGEAENAVEKKEKKRLPVVDEGLVERLHDVLRDPQLGQPRATGEAGLSTPLVHHLIQAWSELTARSFQRMAHDGQLELCLGLTATHYFLADNTDFETLLNGGKEQMLISDADNPFLKVGSYARFREDERGKKDVWSLAYGSTNTRAEGEDFSFDFGQKKGEAVAEPDNTPAPELYDRFSCQIVNISPGGYCIEWAGEVPASVKAGELIGLREEGTGRWSLGAIRWIKQLPGHGAQLGLEIMSPKAQPCGARVIKKTGDATEFMRTLLLPEIKALDRPATLITPNLTFRSGYKLSLLVDGEEQRAQLGRQISTTQSYSQFEFQILRKPGSTPVPEAKTEEPRRDEEDFDSIWSSL